MKSQRPVDFELFIYIFYLIAVKIWISPLSLLILHRQIAALLVGYGIGLKII